MVVVARTNVAYTLISDAEGAAAAIAFAAGLGMIAFLALPYLLISIPFGILALYFLKLAGNRNQGVVFDPKSDLIEFYGGRVPPRSLNDFLDKDWLLQDLKRYHIKISSITQITKTGRGKAPYAVSIQGSFGTASICFYNRDKREQLYNAIRAHNRIGNPVFFP